MLFETDYHKFIQIQSSLVLEVVLVVLVVLVELVDAKLEMISWSSDNKYFSQYTCRTGRACAAARS
jgi:hypothetical protein